MPRPRHRIVLAALLSIGCVALLSLCGRAPQPARETRVAPERRASELGDGVVRPARAPGRRTTPEPEACRPHARWRCFEGDVWWLDGCGELEEPREDCGARLCLDGTCEARDAVACEAPLEGRCDGDQVEVCIAGRTTRIDCGARGLACAMTAEGAECVEEVPRGERCSDGPARCEGNVLVQCETGRRVRTDCGAANAVCASLEGAREPVCAALSLPTDAACGPCGCPADPDGIETCDGRDQDGDGLIDEGIDCGAVPVVAYLATSQRGETSHDEDEIREELSRVNELFTLGGESILRFELAEIRPWVEDEALALTDAGFTRLALDPRLLRPAFHVPVFFTDRIESEGGVPRVGVSTLPNGTCGGVHWGTSPELGLVAVAKGRAPTTLAHELGHFLGLCHTHETRADAPVATSMNDGARSACGDGCTFEGDGVCDTPHDPGPPACSYDARCGSRCERGDEPETDNLMSYYTGCRSRFSPEQVSRMQHTLALRRGWQPCLGGACACTLGAAGCPPEMSCRPVADGARCTLDGPMPPGALCEDGGACGKDALCLHEQARGLTRCVRLCSASRVGCRCADTSEGPKICLDDLE